MALRWIPWLMTNEFIHIQAFLEPLLDQGAISDRLRRRLRKRIKAGLKLVKIRVLIYALMFPAVIALIGSLVFVALDELVAPEVVAGLETLFAALLQIMSLVFVVAAAALFIIQRSMKLLLTDIYLLSMEAVTLAVQAGAPVPSDQEVHLSKRKRTAGRADR